MQSIHSHTVQGIRLAECWVLYNTWDLVWNCVSDQQYFVYVKSTPFRYVVSGLLLKQLSWTDELKLNISRAASKFLLVSAVRHCFELPDFAAYKFYTPSKEMWVLSHDWHDLFWLCEVALNLCLVFPSVT